MAPIGVPGQFVRETKKVLVIALFQLIIILISDGVEGSTRLVSREEDLELDKQLKLLNKPAVKSIKTEYGDIFDCVDIYKQPAFDHPLLKNHTIKMKLPSSFLNGIKEKSSTIGPIPVKIGLKHEGCPPGTVPIRRTNKKELLRARFLSKLGGNRSTNLFENSKEGYQFAYLKVDPGNFKGTKYTLNVWGPKVYWGQFTETQAWVENGPDSIQAGWTVHPELYGDYRTRFFISWTKDNYGSTGCYNLLCPGFVQVHPQLPLGHVIEPVSGFRGPQYEMALRIVKFWGRWYLLAGESGSDVVGYWPDEVFSRLKGSEGNAATVAWGGLAYAHVEEPGPEMGSGYFPNHPYNVACYIRRMKVLDEHYRDVDPGPHNLYATAPRRYYGIDFGDHTPYWEYLYYFGGPRNLYAVED